MRTQGIKTPAERFVSNDQSHITSKQICQICFLAVVVFVGIMPLPKIGYTGTSKIYLWSGLEGLHWILAPFIPLLAPRRLWNMSPAAVETHESHYIVQYCVMKCGQPQTYCNEFLHCCLLELEQYTDFKGSLLYPYTVQPTYKSTKLA